MSSYQYFILIALLSTTIVSISAQLSTIHQDPYQNSFTIQTPSSKQTFTRYFNGAGPQQQAQNLVDNNLQYHTNTGVTAQYQRQQQQQLLLQQQQQQQLIQQQQQYLSSPYQQQSQQNYATNPFQFNSQPIYQQQDEVSPQQYTSQRDLFLQQLQQQQQQQQQIQPTQPTVTSHGLAAYFQQIQRAQQLQQQANAKQQLASTVASTSVAVPEYQQQQQLQQQTDSSSSPDTTNQLLGVSYSPSNEVSQVKFSSGSLNYNF